MKQITSNEAAAPVGREAASRQGLAQRIAADFQERVGPQELRRRLWHVGPGFLPFLLVPFPHADPLSPTLRGIILAIAAGLAITLVLRWSTVRRPNDRWLWSVAGYAGCSLLTLLLFPGHLEITFAVLAVTAFGDGTATLVGKWLGGPRLAWNRNKSVAGTSAFLAIATPMAALAYWSEGLNPERLGGAIRPETAWLVAAAAAFAGALAESLPMKLDDNVRVGAAAAFAAVGTHFLIAV